MGTGNETLLTGTDMRKNQKRKRGLSAQINILIVIGVLIAGVITYFWQYLAAMEEIRKITGIHAAEAAMGMISAVTEYPAYEWLLEYWYENAESLDVEYDVDFESGTATEEKVKLFQKRHPDLSIRYLSRKEAEALPAEDQKLYAEIVYSWILTRVNETKSNLGCDFLFLVETGTEDSGNPYGTQCFLMSGADPDSRRGTNYEEVYTLGVTLPVEKGDSTSESMRKAVETAAKEGPYSREAAGEKIKGAGNYLDYYECLDVIGDHAYLAGVTYNLKDLISQLRIDALKRTLLAAACQFLLLWLVMRHVNLYVIQPLKKILRSIRSYTQTRDSAAVEHDMTSILSGKKAMAVRGNEIGQLAEDFVGLSKEMDDYVAEIRTVTSQKERYETELSIAAQIQTQVLPNNYSGVPEEGFDLYASMTPAREVGGDFYDFFFTDQDHLVLVIGDVSDKGVPAALFMMIAKMLIKDHAKMGESPAQIMSHVNDRLCENNDSGYFVTVWLALINLRTGEGVSVNAGHEHPAVCRAGRVYELIRYRHDPTIGMMEGLSYREHVFRMNRGDRLFVYTDGVPEAVNKDDEQFGTDRMLEVLNRNMEASPRELLAKMKAEIDAFAGDVPQFDDTTMLCFQYTDEHAGHHVSS